MMERKGKTVVSIISLAWCSMICHKDSEYRSGKAKTTNLVKSIRDAK